MVSMLSTHAPGNLLLTIILLLMLTVLWAKRAPAISLLSAAVVVVQPMGIFGNIPRPKFDSLGSYVYPGLQKFDFLKNLWYNIIRK